ncbi:hypothetical protein FPQ18DRAFT_118575 [Pyronema domesticum]|uniref:Uncharacterized protein n=1 Tax=Pyronema omphalodes (strain CBS 100304) TaxID=1076935 RepID=U4LIM8_PYROM|nr:hypothetical protein FPQ18DRAFT_118575 [Pyronema domesticum]CCX31949.1 Protein of unknown function [Pyronema omphalodes CBS 100304]
MVTSNPPVIQPTDVYSTALPQNLRTTDPLISALANYMTGVQTMFDNFAAMKENMVRTGHPDPKALSDGGPAPTKYVAMAINYRQHHELPVSPQELKDAVLIEGMNAFLDKTVEASRFMATIKTVGQQVELNQKYNQMFMENIEKLEKAVLSEEARGVWIRLFGKLGIPAKVAPMCVTLNGKLM